MTPLYNSDSHSRPKVPLRGRSSGWSSGQGYGRRLYEHCIGLRCWVEESTTWGQQLRSAPSQRDFKLEHTGVQGRLPVGVQDSATDVVVDAPLSDGRAGHMERIVAGSGLRRPESCEAADGQLAVLLLGRRCVLGGRPGLPQCRSARTESGVSNRCGRQRAVDDGRAGHMEHTVAGLVSWEAVDGRRAGLLFGRRGCLADGQCSLSARVELRVSSTYGRRRAVDDGRAGHMEHTVAGPWSWKAVDGQRAVPRLIVS